MSFTQWVRDCSGARELSSKNSSPLRVLCGIGRRGSTLAGLFDLTTGVSRGVLPPVPCQAPAVCTVQMGLGSDPSARPSVQTFAYFRGRADVFACRR